jgi:hypothetical protein
MRSVGDELGELDPGLELLVGRLVGELGHGAAHARDDPRVGVEPVEDVIDEVGHDPAALVVGQLGEAVHELHLLWF